MVLHDCITFHHLQVTHHNTMGRGGGYKPLQVILLFLGYRELITLTKNGGQIWELKMIIYRVTSTGIIRKRKSWWLLIKNSQIILANISWEVYGSETLEVGEGCKHMNTAPPSLMEHPTKDPILWIFTNFNISKEG